MIRSFIFSAITAMVLIGCVGPTHNFMIRFNDIEGLRKNDQYSSLAKDSSTFYIDSNPENESQKAIRIIQIDDDGNIIEKNAIVAGQTKYVAIYGQIANKFRKNIRLMESEINDFFKGLQNLSEDEQIKQLERQLDKILSEIENLSAQMKHKLETEILPQSSNGLFLTPPG
jgi:hypothetical protein